MSRILSSLTDSIEVVPSSSINNLLVFTYAAWVYPTNLDSGAVYPVISKDPLVSLLELTLDGDYYGFSKALYGEGPNIAPSFPFSESQPNVVQLNTWQRVALTYDNSGDKFVHLFLNGVELTPPYSQFQQGSGVASPDAAGSMFIGRDGFFTLLGKIAEARVWNAALTPAQITSDYQGVAVLPGNLVVSLGFLTDQGSTEPDLSGHGNSAAITGTTFSSDNPPTPTPPAPPSGLPAARSALSLQSSSGVDYLHLQNKNRVTVGWIDGSGFFGGTLGASSQLPTPAAKIVIIGDGKNDYLQFRNFSGVLAWIDSAGTYHDSGDGLPTAWALKTVFVQNCTDDLMSLQNSSGSVIGWIDPAGDLGGTL